MLFISTAYIPLIQYCLQSCFSVVAVSHVNISSGGGKQKVKRPGAISLNGELQQVLSILLVVCLPVDRSLQK